MWGGQPDHTGCVSPLAAARPAYDAAATAFLDLAAAVAPQRHDDPGLGDWSIRSLLGHTGRSLVTVTTYLGTRAERVAADSAAAYYAAVADLVGHDADGAVRQRGVDAGRALGDDPVRTLREWYADARAALDALGPDDPVVETLVGGMRVSDYLPTRVLELTVHSLDLARAVDAVFEPPAEALAESLRLAADSALALGLGETVLLALTGRERLPPGCSVVP
jgi:uncharacterized protein (TIGR03083 family)